MALVWNTWSSSGFSFSITELIASQGPRVFIGPAFVVTVIIFFWFSARLVTVAMYPTWEGYFSFLDGENRWLSSPIIRLVYYQKCFKLIFLTAKENTNSMRNVIFAFPLHKEKLRSFSVLFLANQTWVILFLRENQYPFYRENSYQMWSNLWVKVFSSLTIFVLFFIYWTNTIILSLILQSSDFENKRLSQ